MVERAHDPDAMRFGKRVLQVHAQVFIRTDDDSAQHMRMFLYQIRRSRIAQQLGEKLSWGYAALRAFAAQMSGDYRVAF
jgi:hypothetical protein